jgi:hypothetical protein
MAESSPAPGDARTRPHLGDPARKAIITVLILGALVGIFFTGMYAVTGSDSTSSNLPDFVDRLIPVSGAEVPRQSAVGIDVAEGYDAYLIVNGEELRTPQDGLIKDLGTGLVQFQPAPGFAIESLLSGQNCIVAYVWNQVEEESTASPVSWCFNAY